MKTSFQIFVLTIGLCFFSHQSKADHYIGMDITYKCSGNNDSIFKITLTFYRDCRGCYILSQSPKCGTSENCNSAGSVPTTLTLSCVGSGSSLGTISMTRTSITDITGLCKSDTSKCSQPCTGKYPFGIEKHIFEGTLDLRAQIKKGCCRFKLGTAGICCRNVYITTGPSGGFYNYLEIDACTKTCNSSPQFTNDPLAIMCCNKPFFYNMGALDADNDSLSYSFDYAYANSSTKSNYTGGYSYSYPMKAYFPTGKTPPYTDPTANPPIGLFLDKSNGDLIFTPTDCSQVGVIVIAVTEWRKDSKGTYQNIGVTSRDLTYTVANCPSDNPPKITNTTYNYSVCEDNKLCFDITTEDKVVGSATPDTVSLSWNSGISDASFTIKDAKAREKAATFCWTPKTGTSSDIPYTFIVNATSNSCPLTASAIRTFTVKVNPAAKADCTYSKLGCNYYQVKSTSKTGIINPATFSWQVIDSTGKPIADSLAFFNFGKNSSTKGSDTLSVKKAGKYYIKHIINDSRNCPTVYFDTLIVPQRLNVVSVLGKDTTVCPGTMIDLKVNVKIGVPKYKYQWITPAKNIKDTLATFRLTTSNRDTILQIEVRDANGCIAYDTLLIHSFKQIPVNLGNALAICSGDSVKLDAGNNVSYKWNTGKNTRTIMVNTAGKYSVNVTDANGCASSDSISISILSLPKPNLGSISTFCKGDSLKLDPGSFSAYLWNNGKTSRSIYAKTAGKYKVTVTDAKGCNGKDSLTVSLLNLPVVNLGNDIELCSGDSTSLDAGTFISYKWNTGKTTKTIMAKTQGKFKVTVTDGNGCKGSDSLDLKLLQSPKPNLGKDTIICQGDSLKLNPGAFTSYKWSNGKTVQSIYTKTQGNYNVTVTDSKGCKGSDSIKVSVSPLPNVNLGRDTTICNGDSIKLDAGVFTSYKWSNGKNTRNIMVKSQADYSVEVTNSSGCKNSDGIFVTFKKCSGDLVSTSLKNVKVYPNPAVDILTIEFINSGINAHISIQDLNGKTILEKQILTKGLVNEQINIKNFERGYYIVEINTDEGSFSGKVLLK